VAEKAGNSDQALRLLREAAAVDPPRSMAPADGRVVRQDLYFRVASLELSAGRPNAALQAAEQGLQLGSAPDVFTANLWIAKGKAHEKLGADREAASDFYQALEINDRLLRKTMGVKRVNP
jgi:tetratricopeptide (TPR) repeat protein